MTFTDSLMKSSKLLLAAAAMSGFALTAGVAQADDNTKASKSGSIFPTAVTQCKGCFAVVNATGTLARGKNVQSVTKLGTGTYEVIFKLPITKCAFGSTIGLSTFVNSSPPGETTVVGRVGTTNGVFLQTFSSAGVTADRGFHLTITCP